MHATIIGGGFHIGNIERIEISKGSGSVIYGDAQLLEPFKSILKIKLV